MNVNNLKILIIVVFALIAIYVQTTINNEFHSTINNKIDSIEHKLLKLEKKIIEIKVKNKE